MLDSFLQKIYKGFDTSSEIEPSMWREVLRIINEGTVEGLSQAAVPPTHDRLFYQNLRHSNEVFAAFKVHTMGLEMAAKLIDADGGLKSFDRWLSDVSNISSHQVGSWLRTEYDTAVIRAHAAADWQEFERNKDIMPNLRWMPTTSPNPESSHQFYWKSGLTLPVDDPFWNEHHPGDRWNCKCSLEATDEPVVRPDGLESTRSQRGLENNPGKDGHIFNDTHPYFPSDCSHCFAYKKGGFSNRLKALLLNREKDCYNCPFIEGCMGRIVENKKEYERLLKDDEYIDVHYNSKTGGIKATHIGHNKTGGDYDLELECQDLLYKWGHIAVLRNEFTHLKISDRPASLDLEIDGKLMDIRSITTAKTYGGAMMSKNNQLGRVKKKTGIVADSLCLHFHDPARFSEEQILHDIEWYKQRVTAVGTTQRIKHIYVVVNGADSLKIYDI